MRTLWVCGKLLATGPDAWEFQGVFSTEALAVAACDGRPDYFIAPIALDFVVPDARAEWPGAYSPAAR
jgi:hypothetical protein